MKQWMSDNADTYDEFEVLMNSQSDTGYQKIMAQAVALIPKYEKAVSKKMNSGSVEDTLDIEALFADENMGAKLVREFDTFRKESVIPAAICWLFFGRSFENMVERGEAIMNNPNVNRFQSFIVARTTKMLIKKSIDLGLRTHEDWDEYDHLKKTIDSSEVMDWVLARQEDVEPQALSLRKVETVSTLESMLLLDDEHKSILLSRIGDYLNTGVKGKRVAFMILALRQLGYLPEITSDRQLFVALRSHFNTYIGSDKSIYAYLDGQRTKHFQVEIDDLAVYFDVN